MHLLFETSTFGDVAKELLSEIEPRQQQGGVDLIGLPTGFEDLNYALGGYRKQEVYIIAGATGSGKSAFCMNAGLQLARHGASVLYLSLEMSSRILVLRTLSAATGIPAMAIERGQLSDETWKFIQSEIETLSKLPIYFYDRVVTTDEWRMVMEAHKNQFGLDIGIVDYNALMRDKGNSPYERVTNISIALKGHAKDFDIPYLVAAQLNRASLDGPPTLKALKESGQVENDAGVVLFPYRLPRDEESHPEFDEAKIIIAKNRHGPVGEFPAEFHFKQMVWKSKEGVPIPPPNVKQTGVRQ